MSKDRKDVGGESSMLSNPTTKCKHHLPQSHYNPHRSPQSTNHPPSHQLTTHAPKTFHIPIKYPSTRKNNVHNPNNPQTKPPHLPPPTSLRTHPPPLASHLERHHNRRNPRSLLGARNLPSANILPAPIVPQNPCDSNASQFLLRVERPRDLLLRHESDGFERCGKRSHLEL